MKLALMTSLIIAVASISSFAADAKPCQRCGELDAVTAKLKKKDPDAIEIAQDKLREFQFDKNLEIRRQEIVSFVNMGLEAIDRDDSGESDSYFLNAYKEDKTSFNLAIAKLPEAQQKRIKRSLGATAHSLKHGNGGK